MTQNEKSLSHKIYEFFPTHDSKGNNNYRGFDKFLFIFYVHFIFHKSFSSILMVGSA